MLWRLRLRRKPYLRGSDGVVWPTGLAAHAGVAVAGPAGEMSTHPAGWAESSVECGLAHEYRFVHPRLGGAMANLAEPERPETGLVSAEY